MKIPDNKKQIVTPFHELCAQRNLCEKLILSHYFTECQITDTFQRRILNSKEPLGISKKYTHILEFMAKQPKTVYWLRSYAKVTLWRENEFSCFVKLGVWQTMKIPVRGTKICCDVTELHTFVPNYSNHRGWITRLMCKFLLGCNVQEERNGEQNFGSVYPFRFYWCYHWDKVINILEYNFLFLHGHGNLGEGWSILSALNTKYSSRGSKAGRCYESLDMLVNYFGHNLHCYYSRTAPYIILNRDKTVYIYDTCIWIKVKTDEQFLIVKRIRWTQFW